MAQRSDRRNPRSSFATTTVAAASSSRGRLWALLTAGAAAQRELEGDGRTVTIVNPPQPATAGNEGDLTLAAHAVSQVDLCHPIMASELIAQACIGLIEAGQAHFPRIHASL